MIFLEEYDLDKSTFLRTFSQREKYDIRIIDTPQGEKALVKIDGLRTGIEIGIGYLLDNPGKVVDWIISANTANKDFISSSSVGALW